MRSKTNKPLVVKKAKYMVTLVSTGYFRELEIRDKQREKKSQESPTQMLRSLMLAKGRK